MRQLETADPSGDGAGLTAGPSHWESWHGVTVQVPDSWEYGSLSDGFTYYNDLTPDQVKQLADGVNALGEPLSQLTATLVG